MGCGHHTLSVDLDDAVADADTPSLRNTPSHEAADLWGQVKSAHTWPPHPARVPPCPKDTRREATFAGTQSVTHDS